MKNVTELELNEARRLFKEIYDTEIKLKTLQISAQKLVPILDGLPRAKSQRSKVEELTVKIMELEEELAALTVEFVQAATTLHQKIFTAPNLDALEKAILSLRYATCLNFSEIQTELKLTEATTFYLHRTAKKKILKTNTVD